MTQFKVVPYQSSWSSEFVAQIKHLLPIIHDQVDRIDHIGSTSVPGLAAKDIIDIQISVPTLSQVFIDTMSQNGYRYHSHLKDNSPFGADPFQWQKQVFTGPPGTMRFNIHVRRLNADNMLQALLFRDYLRSRPSLVIAYGTLKQRLADRHSNDRPFYYAIKDTLFEIIWEAAQYWATNTNWQYNDIG